MQSQHCCSCLPGALIFCSMSTWDGSDGAPLFMTDEKSCKPQLVGIYNYSRKHPRKGAGEDVALTNIGCKIHHIKGHVATGQWSKKGQISCSCVPVPGSAQAT